MKIKGLKLKKECPKLLDNDSQVPNFGNCKIITGQIKQRNYFLVEESMQAEC